jgi:hypothetical protein
MATRKGKRGSSSLVARRQAAERLGYRSAWALRRLEAEGKLTPIRVNSRRTCYRAEDIERLIAAMA